MIWPFQETFYEQSCSCLFILSKTRRYLFCKTSIGRPILKASLVKIIEQKSLNQIPLVWCNRNSPPMVHSPFLCLVWRRWTFVYDICQYTQSSSLRSTREQRFLNKQHLHHLLIVLPMLLAERLVTSLWLVTSNFPDWLRWGCPAITQLMYFVHHI